MALDDLPFEAQIREKLERTTDRLRELREQKKGIDAEVRTLVAHEKTQKRLLAVFERERRREAKKSEAAA